MEEATWVGRDFSWRYSSCMLYNLRTIRRSGAAAALASSLVSSSCASEAIRQRILSFASFCLQVEMAAS
eukprot:1191891-Prorocentrum_minimum.AAC.1